MRYRQVTLLAFAAVALLWLAAPRAGRSAAVEVTTAQRRARAAACARKPRVDYTAFSHRTAAHRKSCDACHKFPSENWKEVRAKDPFPDLTEYPEHSSCITCHREQFFARERPAPKICSNCHTGVTPRNTARHPFPNPAERFDASPRSAGHVSDFKVFFPHDKHLELFSEVRPAHREGARFVRASYRAAPQESDPKSCANCHQTYMPQGDSDDEYVTKPPKGLADEAFWLKKGTYKTSPRDHATCFTCHSADGGIDPQPSSCATCHKIPAEPNPSITRAHDDFDPALAATMKVADRRTLLMWSRREAGRFRHEWAPHDLACTACHNPSAMDTTDEATKHVAVKSCGGEGTGCHVEPTGDGALNVEVGKKLADASYQCTKCHVAQGRQPAPSAHVAVVNESTKKK